MDNIQLQSEIMKESDSLQEETQKVIKEAEEKLTDVMLALEKVIESVTGPPSISVSLPPTTQPFSEGQAQQNNILPPTSLQQATQPSSAGQAQDDASPPSSLAHNKHPNPPIRNRYSRMLPYHLLPHNKYPTYIVSSLFLLMSPQSLLSTLAKYHLKQKIMNNCTLK